MSDEREYPRPSLTADVVVVAPGEGGELRVLFVKRGHDPFAGAWAFPGGFVNPDEAVAEAAARELREETSLTGVPVEELGCFSKPGRDPRGWVVTIAHLARVPESKLREVKAADDAADAEWLDLTLEEGGGYRLSHRGTPVTSLAFDHADILARAVLRLRAEGRRP